MKRAGRRAARQIRRERVAFLRKHWPRYLALAVLLLAAAAVSMLLLGPMMRAYLAGIYTAMFFALAGYSLMVDGSHLRMMGAEAERWTSQALRKIDGWWVLDGLEFHDGDIDHVVVGAARVLAVETKWTSREVCIDERGVRGLWCDGVGQAAWGARRLENFLRSKGVRQPVTPVLVIWGANVQHIPSGYRQIDGVRVLVGAQADEWRPKLQQLPQWSHSTVGVPEAIEEYVDRFEQREFPSWRHRVRAALGLA